MNILYIAEGFDRSEAAYIQRIAERGHDVEIMLSSSSSCPALEESDLPITRIPLASRIDRASIAIIQERLERGDLDVVHCLRNNRPLANTLLANKKAKVKLVAYRGTVGHLSRWNPGSWLTYFSARISVITCVSDAVRQYLLKQGVSNKRLLTLYKGHDPSWYQVDNKADLGELDIPNDAIVLCCAANMRPVKGVDVLIKAMERVPEDTKVHLLLVGEVMDDRIMPLYESSSAKSRIHFAGFRPDAPRWTAASELFTMPSVSREGLPRAVIEAMSMGIPPIVSAVGGMVELVEDDVSGLVVPPSDPHALADAIVKLASDEDLRARLGSGAKAQIEGPFSIDHTVDELERCYKTLCSTTAS